MSSQRRHANRALIFTLAWVLSCSAFVSARGQRRQQEAAAEYPPQLLTELKQIQQAALASDYACYRALPSAAAEYLPVARRVANEVLCLPLYGALTPDDARRICAMIAYCLQQP